jgi:hypothetical protein
MEPAEIQGGEPPGPRRSENTAWLRASARLAGAVQEGGLGV